MVGKYPIYTSVHSFPLQNGNPQIEYRPLVNTVSNDVLKCNTTEKKKRSAAPFSYTWHSSQTYLSACTISQHHKLSIQLHHPPDMISSWEASIWSIPLLAYRLRRHRKKKDLLKISWTEDKFYQPQSPFEVIRPDIPFFFFTSTAIRKVSPTPQWA